MKPADAVEPIPVSSRAALAADAKKAERRKELAAEALVSMATGVERDFRESQRVLSFGEYLELFASHPERYGRGASEYVCDMFLHYGTRAVERPWGTVNRFRLFDAPWHVAEAGERAVRLIGQEAVQEEIYRSLSNFVREGRANRLVLMHGPNGSAKSTAAACILRALEQYSKTDEGALYRFHWIFPTRRTSRGSIGFGGGIPARELESYAHLEDGEIDARLVIELRDHPLFLLPVEQRATMLERLWEAAGADARPCAWLQAGELSHKNKQIYEALLASYGGSLVDVLRHVQVERYYISRRYRVGAVTLGPEMTADAGERQITADRSVAALPTSLQATTLFEAHGELVEAAGGVLEFSDLLKRPLEAFRYLQLTLETGEVALPQQTVFTNVVMVGSANDIHLTAFREHPEYASFRGRLQPIVVPFLRSYFDEEQIYVTQIVPQLRCHVAPHATRVAAEFAVLTRMRRPDAGSYDKPLAKILDDLTALEKMVLYTEGTPPTRLNNEQRKLLRANIGAIYRETEADRDYEGGIGVSAREMRTVLLDAAQNEHYAGLSPFGVLYELDELCKRADYDWLRLKPLPGGYHDHGSFREIVRTRLMDRIEADLRVASGLIDEKQYSELFGRYIDHVSLWVKGEKVRNKVTGQDERPDENIMREVEGLFDIKGDPEEHRHTLISRIAAWAIDNPGETPRHEEIFPGYVARLQDAAFSRLRKPFAGVLRSTVALLRGEQSALAPDELRRAVETVAAMKRLGYEEPSALDASSALLRGRFGDIVH